MGRGVNELEPNVMELYAACVFERGRILLAERNVD